MPIDTDQARRHLREFDFKPLFNELGWDRHDQAMTVEVADTAYQLTGVAQKRGVQVFHCPSPSDDGLIPDNTTLRKIERKVRQAAAENLIIFTDQHQTEQKWYWVRRLVGEPDRPRSIDYVKGQHGDAIVQRLNHLLITLEDEERITSLDAADKLKQAFDSNAEKVTKRFFKQFQDEHKRFLGFIEGLADAADRRWYASIMLNRLMFIYFIQKKGFLDADPDYLRNRLQRVQAERGEGHFMSFYRTFLRRLMHEGLGSSPAYRPDDLAALIGRVPYLNGGIFAPHTLELTNPDIDIPDTAFEHIFDFFDQYHWHLDDRKTRLGHRQPDDNEINPDVLGYIFEKYINQKQMGAYYTKEDITQYISQNTIIPFLFDKARTDKDHGCANAFRPNAAMWKLLADEPDRYIYDAVRKGVIDDDTGEVIPLPENIAAGIDDVSKRGDWNRSADEAFALPTEIWREHVARRQRCIELREKLAAGNVTEVNDLVTLNLNIRRFAQDVIEECEGPELLRAFWHALTTLSVLDPTCGSGAFLFAAMDILEPLYEACLDRMADFIATADALKQLPKGKQPKLTKRQEQAYADFRATLAEIDRHPNRAYFIFKTIVLNNLYGVDIMDEATEICRLRLFLKLVAQVEPDTNDPNLGVEPLPDIDFNIKTGNTLVGFTSIEEVATASERAGRLGFDVGIVERIRIEAGGIAQRFREFRNAQQDGDADSESLQQQKRALVDALQALADQLDNYLAGEYGIDPDDPKQAKRFEQWRQSHQPFHWITEFYGVMGDGGFDVVIGNPPYLEVNEVNYELRGLATADTRAVHSMCVERSLALMHTNSAISMIVPLALVSTQRMRMVQSILEDGRTALYANFAWRPGKLFDTVNRALTIFVALRADEPSTWSTAYQKWNSSARDLVFPAMAPVKTAREREHYWVPKCGSAIERNILAKCFSADRRIGDYVGGNASIYYRTTGGLYWKVFTDFAPLFWRNGKKGSSSRETTMQFQRAEWVRPMIALLSSDVFWWWYTVSSNLRDLNPGDIQAFPVPSAAIDSGSIAELGARYVDDLQAHSELLVREQKQTGTTKTQSFKVQKSKRLIDEIDRVLAEHYGFSDEEVDFIINYDIKYRLGRDTGEDDDVPKA